jgi:thiol-disulfide isomerase/thioredoxin
MNWRSVVIMMILLLPSSGHGSAAEAETDLPDRTILGEFMRSAQRSPAPSITFSEIAGDTVPLTDFRGKLVVVNLWATWCAPCLREMPSLDRLQSHFGERLAVLAVSEDRGGSKIVEPFITKLGLKSVKFFVDPKSEVGHALNVRGLPTSVLIDREGKVLGRVEGAADWDSPKMLGIIEPLVTADGLVKTSSH